MMLDSSVSLDISWLITTGHMVQGIHIHPMVREGNGYKFAVTKAHATTDGVP
jgi:hypothetical protein